MTESFPQELLKAARDARDKAIAPYSGYRVGAALLTGSGEIITAGNIESSSYGLTICAERVALFSALSDGHRKFKAVAVATPDMASPCGACRQVLWEYAGDCTVYITDSSGEVERYDLSELFRRPFGGPDRSRGKDSP